MKILVSDDSELIDLECQMKGMRHDVVLEVYGKYYMLEVNEIIDVKQFILRNPQYSYEINLLIVNDVSLKNIIEVIKYNVKHKRYLDMNPGTNCDISDWKVIYSE